MANNYKVKMKDIQNKYKFKIFCAGYEYDDTELRNAINQRALISEAGRYIELELNPNTYVLTAKLKDKNNNLISTSTPIDLPLESMIVDCDYDATTKSLIITLQNGNTTSIPLGDLIEGLATEEDLNEVRDNLEVVQNELNQYKTIYNVLPKVENEGEALTLDDTGNALMKLDLKGNGGKNLLETKIATETKNGVTITHNEDGSYTLDGTATSGFAFESATYSQTFKAGTYTLGSSATLPNGLFYSLLERNVYYFYTRYGIDTATQTFDEDTTINAFREYMWIANGTTFDNFVLKPQVEQGSNASNYEPYGASVTGDNTIKVEGKNLINFEDIQYTITNGYYKDFDTGIIFTEDMVHKIFSISYDIEITNYTGTPTSFFGVTGRTTNPPGMQTQMVAKSFTISSEKIRAKIENVTIGEYVGQHFIFRPAGFSAPITGTFNVSNVQMEWGTTSSDFEPYQSQSYPINIGTTKLQTDDTIQGTIDNWEIKKADGTIVAITDATLITQLNNLKNNVMSYQGQTNISQVNNDLPFIIDASALKDLSNL